MQRIIRRMAVILIWVIISLIIYWCSVMNEHDYEGSDTNVIDEKEDEESSVISENVQNDQIIEDNGTIRVLIRTDRYENLYHKEIAFKSRTGLYVEQNGEISEYNKNETYILTPKILEKGDICVYARGQGRVILDNVARSEPVSYRGIMECYGTDMGIILINELSVEEYLYGVVPSEMPSSYPLEALKAQAICARTYTYFHKKMYAYPEWKANIDDSSLYQVYQNIEENCNSTQAVDSTKGKVIAYNNDVIECFYYATSSGASSGYEIWDADKNPGYLKARSFNGIVQTANMSNEKSDVFSNKEEENEIQYRKYIDNGNPEDIEYNEPWYRWLYNKKIDSDSLLKKVISVDTDYPDKITVTNEEKGVNVDINELNNEKKIVSIEVKDRLDSGLVNELMIKTQNYDVSVRTQNCIRRILSENGDTVVKNDMTFYIMGDLLPSAYFYIDNIYDGSELSELVIHGGGLGHGAGMSQNGAKCLANKGYSAEQILNYYYNDIELRFE